MKLLKSPKEMDVLLPLVCSLMLSACGGQPESATTTEQSAATSQSADIDVATAATIAVGGAVTDVKLQSTDTVGQSNVPLTFGQVFAQGHLLTSESLFGRLSDGRTVPLQLDVKATHPDGSVRHAVISAVMPSLAAGQTNAISLVKTRTTPTAQSGSSPAALLNAGFTTSVNINLGGVMYTASADALLKAGKYTTWLAGPVATEWLVSAPLKTASGAQHPHLTARFAIRSYAGLNKAKVDVIIENNWAYEPGPQNFTYDAHVMVGGQTAYSKSALTHYHHARWRKSFWWGTTPKAHTRHNTAYLIASRALPNYDQTVRVSTTALSSLKSQFSGAAAEPMRTGLASPAMPNTGGRRDIGLLPGWAAMYLLSMDEGAKTATLGTADLAGSWSGHYRDKKTDRVVSLIDYPYMTILGRPADTVNPATGKSEAFPACGGTCANPNLLDSSHQPGFAYLPYLVTGDHFYLEELQFYTMWNLFQHNPGYREREKGLVKGDQVRGQAWSLRSLSQAAYITPDKDPLKKQFEGFLSHNLDWYNSTYTNNSSANKLGALTHGYAAVYNGGRGVGPWQDDFFTSAVGHAAELGFSKAKPLLAWKAKFPVGRMTGAGYCWILGSDYSVNVRDSTSSPLYTTFAQAYKESNPATLASLQCASAAMASNLGLRVGEMVGYASANTGYPSNMQPALAYSADSGTLNGANAWRVFLGRSVKPDYSTGPQFAIVPR